MSITTTLRLKRAPEMSHVQPTTLGRDHARSSQYTTTGMRTARSNDVLDVVLLIVSEDDVAQDDRAVAGILATVLLEGLAYQQRIDQQTKIQVVVRSYVEDSLLGIPMGQSIFRQLLGDRFDQDQMTSTRFTRRRGESGVIIAQWRSETRPVDGSARKRQAVHEVVRPVVTGPVLGDLNANPMAHWSWWAERSLLKESAS